mmetsp:Transcript_13758/g.45477  ORF Transcript_13758/g.45477 Transcript_13758/m.45477 type:complete len:372 (+) Transcript_13758:150-1265(+)
MKTRVRAPALRRANPKAPLVPASVKKPARKAVSTIRRKTTKNAPKQMKAADRRRIIHSRTKTLMRHCGVGHRRGAFGDKSYRDRVGAVLQSVYGNTFKEGSWWYQNPDAGLFFAKVFSAATGFKTNVTPTQAEAVFVKNEGTKKMFVCERAMLQAGFTVAQVTSLYEQTPAAAWNADDDVSERFIQVQVPVAKTKPLVSLAAAAACPSSAVKSVPTSLGSSRYSPVNTQIQRNIDHQIQRGITCSSASGSARWVPSSEDDDDDDRRMTTRLAHIRGHCIGELGVRGFAKAYRAAKLQIETAGGFGTASNTNERDNDALTKIVGTEKTECVALLEMLVLLENVQRESGSSETNAPPVDDLETLVTMLETKRR